MGYCWRHPHLGGRSTGLVVDVESIADTAADVQSAGAIRRTYGHTRVCACHHRPSRAVVPRSPHTSAPLHIVDSHALDRDLQSPGLLERRVGGRHREKGQCFACPYPIENNVADYRDVEVPTDRHMLIGKPGNVYHLPVTNEADERPARPSAFFFFI